jgi:hypothetical protein
MTILIILFVAVAFLTVFSFCRVAGECKREEEMQQLQEIQSEICPCYTGREANSMNKIDYAERVAVYERTIARNGVLLQAIVALEELSECQKEICKFLREQGNIEHIAEEVADATIMLEQLRIIFDINAKVCMYMDEKVQRLADNLKGGD